jgi:hypothetical protein
MKAWHWGIVILGILGFLFLLPPSIKCKLYFWSKDSCSQVSDILQNVGVDPNAPPVTQFDELAEGFQNA